MTTSERSRASKMPSAERKAQIARAAAKLFAERGFHATTLKAIASGAGVSEALLLKYFPTKEDLMKAALEACRNTTFFASLQGLLPSEPSTRALVHAVKVMTEQITLTPRHADRESRDTINRMLLRSLAEDGEFASVMLGDVNSRLGTFIAACLDKAGAAGDLDESAPQPPQLAAWFRVHLSIAVQAFQLPEKSPVSYGAGEKQFADALIRFQLLGLGLKGCVVRRYLSNEETRV